jgi:imidazoleglycerol phosphate synthase cyclase subunit
VVKGVQFQNLRDAGDPAELAALYEQEGADELAMLDVSATPQGRLAALQAVHAVRLRINIPLSVGGGVRGADDVARLLEAGADKVVINSGAVRDPELLRTCSRQFGAQCILLAIDAQRVGEQWRVRVQSGAELLDLDAIAWASTGASLGAGEILLTSWDRDGTGHGYDLELTSAVLNAVRVPVIASGGAAHIDHLRQALHAGADAVLAASIFHSRQVRISDAKRSLAADGLLMRQETVS